MHNHVLNLNSIFIFSFFMHLLYHDMHEKCIKKKILLYFVVIVQTLGTKQSNNIANSNFKNCCHRYIQINLHY